MLIDLLVQLPNRSSEVVDRFLSVFRGDFVPSADEFDCYFDETSDALLFDTYQDGLAFLTGSPNSIGVIYFRNVRSEGLIRHLYISFAKDGSVFGGASVDEPDVGTAQQLMSDKFGSKILVGLECYPPDSAEDFSMILEAWGTEC